MAEIENNLNEAVKKLEAMQISNSEFEKVMQAMVKKVLAQARKQISAAARSALPKDPREAYKAVRHSIYKRILGGNVSILSKRRRSGKVAAVAESRRGRSERTQNLMSYYGADRGFILRFLNSGTDQRQVEHMNNHSIRRNDHYRPKGTQQNRNYKPERQYKGRLGNRGSLRARNWFPEAGQKAMEQAAEMLAQLIEKEISKRL